MQFLCTFEKNDKMNKEALMLRCLKNIITKVQEADPLQYTLDDKHALYNSETWLKVKNFSC